MDYIFAVSLDMEMVDMILNKDSALMEVVLDRQLEKNNGKDVKRLHVQRLIKRKSIIVISKN